MSSQSGYYRFPSVYQDHVVFVSDDDLWLYEKKTAIPRRLTSSKGEITRPQISPDGKWIAFSSKEEGHLEVYRIPLLGGEIERLSHQGGLNFVIGWSKEGRILVSSNLGQPFARRYEIFDLDPETHEMKARKIGRAFYLSENPNGEGSVLARVMTRGSGEYEPAHWKRYRGGTAGDLWIDRGDGEFKRLIDLKGNSSRPLWIKDRIVFLSDHEGVGRLYSCDLEGGDLKALTQNKEYYVRNPSSDGSQIVYHSGGDLYCMEADGSKHEKLELEFRTPRPQRQRKFVIGSRSWQHLALNSGNSQLALTARGKLFRFGAFEGPVVQCGTQDGVRYRLPVWTKHEKKFIVLSDESGEEKLELYDAEQNKRIKEFDEDIGRLKSIKPSPKHDHFAATNHRNELILIDLEKEKIEILDRSEHEQIAGFNWSPDGRWIAYNASVSTHTSVIKLIECDNKKIYEITKPILKDFSPSFDPEGKYLYFLSQRDFNPVYDMMHFDLGFPEGVRPFLITLQEDTPSPFLPLPQWKPKKDGDDQEDENNDSEEENEQDSKDSKKDKDEEKKDEPIKIDLDGIQDRVLAFPVSEGIYTQIEGIEGKALFLSHPMEGTLEDPQLADDHDFEEGGTLQAYRFNDLKTEDLAEEIDAFSLSRDRKKMVLKTGRKIRICNAGEKPSDSKNPRKSGWVDLSRVRVQVQLSKEWKQMFREAWRLQRDHFWTEDMSQIDWQKVWKRYEPLVDRVSTRGEFSDLLWELQGELGTSHAYEMGGDHRRNPHYGMGYLGADIHFDPNKKSYVIDSIPQGDQWIATRSSPLRAPGIGLSPQDEILEINGHPLDSPDALGRALLNQAGAVVSAKVKRKGEEKEVFFKTLRSEQALRYRNWVEFNRKYVHEKTEGRIGYVHIPDMSAHGYAEFHRYFLSEVDRDGLIVDVRYNGGGHVSQLILEKLARKRLGYDQSRWFGVKPYPDDAVAGPLVSITNENAGSDGDIFSHCFKLMKLGPLIGKRTWGGVIGIWPRHALVDGGVTTQPEFSFWFKDVGWSIENHGAEPDIEVEIPPHIEAKEEDPQLDRGIEEIRKLLDQHEEKLPDLKSKPKLG